MFTPDVASRHGQQLGGDAEWWKGGIIYQVYPRSYLDTNGDGIGDLSGITAKLDYIQALSVDAIWISPFFVSPMDDFGYDVSDYCDVDPMFGTIGDFDRLLDGAHERGMRILVDLVISHTSAKHQWFTESRSSRNNAKADWYVWADPKPDGSPPNNWLSIFGGSAWEWDSRRRQYYLHNFLTSQPDLNFHNRDVQDAVLGAARFWLERGVDGFRLDTVNMYFHDADLRDNPAIEPGQHVNGIPEQNPYAMQQPIHNITRPENLQFLERLRDLMDAFPATACVGEIGAVLNMYDVLADYTEAGKRLHMAYSFDFLSRTFSAAHIRTVVERMEANPDSWPSWAFSNHDVERVVTRWGQGMHADYMGPLLTVLLASLRGTPCLYQGDELGLSEAIVPFEMLRDPYGIRFWPDYAGRDGCRTPMPWNDGARHAGFTSAEEPWLPVPDDHRQRAVTLQDHAISSPLNRVRRFMRWRRENPVLAKGSIRFVDAPEPVVAFLRQLPEDNSPLLCAFNLGPDPVRFDTGGLREIGLASGHGFAGRMEKTQVVLDGFDAYFGHVS
ncbi:MAG: alpha-amylase family glycosyl hydrolase [Pseudomonadota bacterium]